MRFSELVRLLEQEGFRLVKEKGLDPLLRQSWPSASNSCRLPRREGGSDRHLPRDLESGRRKTKIKNHDYPAIFTRYRSNQGAGFFWLLLSDLEGFAGIGHSVEDCLYKARWGMADHVRTMHEQGLPVPKQNPDPTIVIQNEPKLQPA
jgi:hypothetical protein